MFHCICHFFYCRYWHVVIFRLCCPLWKSSAYARSAFSLSLQSRVLHRCWSNARNSTTIHSSNQPWCWIQNSNPSKFIIKIFGCKTCVAQYHSRYSFENVLLIVRRLPGRLAQLFKVLLKAHWIICSLTWSYLICASGGSNPVPSARQTPPNLFP